MDLAHRQVVRGAPLGIDKEQLLTTERASLTGKRVAGGGQRGARRDGGRAGGCLVADLLLSELELMAELAEVPGLAPMPKVVFRTPVTHGPIPTPSYGPGRVWPRV
jgi:hypothetical protein